MSPPEQKARPPALATTTRATRGSSSKSSSARGDRAHHRQRQRVERARSIEDDEAGRAAAFGVNRRSVARRGGFCHFTFASAASMPGGDVGDRRHAVDFMQRALGGVIGRHRRGVAKVGGEPGLENFRIVVLAHRLAGGLGLGGAIDDARDELLGVDLQLDRRVELQPLARQHRVERLGLGERARKAVENESLLRVGLIEALVDDAGDDVVGNQRRPIPSPPWP